MTFKSAHNDHHIVWAPLALGLLVSACGTLGPQDGAPQRVLDADAIQDAQPRYEPLSKYGNPDSYVVAGKRYNVLDSAKGYVQRGVASWYGTKFHGRATSSGEPYDMYAMSAAHKSLPLPTYVRVTNLNNRKSAIVKVNDRGPFHSDRLIDLSYAAAVKLGIAAYGTAPVEVKAIEVTPVAQTQATQIPVTQTSTAIAGGHFVQVGAFSDRGNAERLVQKISLQIPFPVSISSTNDTYYRVRVGPFRDWKQVQSVQSQLSNLGINDVMVLSD
jgi:rare lipoprotein A